MCVCVCVPASRQQLCDDLWVRTYLRHDYPAQLSEVWRVLVIQVYRRKNMSSVFEQFASASSLPTLAGRVAAPLLP